MKNYLGGQKRREEKRHLQMAGQHGRTESKEETATSAGMQNVYVLLI